MIWDSNSQNVKHFNVNTFVTHWLSCFVNSAFMKDKQPSLPTFFNFTYGPTDFHRMDLHSLCDLEVPYSLIYIRFITRIVTGVYWYKLEESESHEKGTRAHLKEQLSLDHSLRHLYHFQIFTLPCLGRMIYVRRQCLTTGLPSVQRKSLSNILSFRPTHW